jgi:3',5'-cyclic AMP phosphodiesterase CpdA
VVSWKRTPPARAFILALSAALALAGCGAKGGGEGASASQPAQGKAGEFRPFTFIHASDSHFGVGEGTQPIRDRFGELTRQANELRPAFVLVTGDLVTDGNNPEELAAMDTALKAFRVPVKLLPGNHDDLEAYRAHFGPAYHRFTVNNCEFICVDSTGLAMATEQWLWLEDSLLDARRRGRTHIFLALHEPPTVVSYKDRLERLIREYGVHIVLAGHLHRTVEIESDGYTTYVSPSTSYNRDRTPPGYRVFKVFADHVEQEVASAAEPAIR